MIPTTTTKMCNPLLFLMPCIEDQSLRDMEEKAAEIVFFVGKNYSEGSCVLKLTRMINNEA